MNIAVLLVTIRHGLLYVALGATIVEYLGCFAICVIATRVYEYSLKERFFDTCKPVVSATIMAFAIYGVSKLEIRMNLVALMLQTLSGFIVFVFSSIILRDQCLKDVYSKGINVYFKLKNRRMK